jgi:hypothetical protein
VKIRVTRFVTDTDSTEPVPSCPSPRDDMEGKEMTLSSHCALNYLSSLQYGKAFELVNKAFVSTHKTY